MKKVAKPEGPVRVALVSLGCAKNLVDSEVMIGILLCAGIEITNDPAEADAVIINTCSFIDSAKAESVDAVLDCAALRDSRNRTQALVVAGCLPQKFRHQLPTLLPEVETFVGTDEVSRIADVVQKAVALRAKRLLAEQLVPGARRKSTPRRKQHSPRLNEPHVFGPEHKTGHGHLAPIVQVAARPEYIPDCRTPRLRLTPRHYAYVKIAEGCNHPCSFCTIPRVRGRQRSRAIADIVTEVRELLADGVRELNLIAQDATAYGCDLVRRESKNRSTAIGLAERHMTGTSVPSLSTLLQALQELPGEFWIRVLYTHPASWNDELIKTIASCPKVARYIDIPLQHIHDVVLERMRREISRPRLLELLQRIRSGIPNVALRTTFIVGFPGETERCFQELLDFVRTARFERLGVFTYSQEEGTIAARMADQVPEDVKQQRMHLVLQEQRRISRDVAASLVGKRIRVLVEGRADRKTMRQAGAFSWEHGASRAFPDVSDKRSKRTWLAARSEMDAPEIDGCVYVDGTWPLGEFVWARVVGHTDYDLVARIDHIPESI